MVQPVCGSGGCGLEPFLSVPDHIKLSWLGKDQQKNSSHKLAHENASEVIGSQKNANLLALIGDAAGQ